MTEYAVVDPATGERVAAYELSTPSQIEASLAACARAWRAWSATAVADRAAALRRVAAAHREHLEEFADTIVREMGKPLSAAREEVGFAAEIIEYYADNAVRITADRPIELAEGSAGSAVIRRSSLGVLLGIMPWNFPAYQVARFAAPNLLLGNTIVLKHAPQCPQSAALLERLYAAEGMVEGAYVNVYASNEQAASIIADPRVHGVSVTGSERAGSAVAEIAGRHLKKVALELGGSDPFILLSTPDLDAAVGAAVQARLDNNGQSCNGAKRFIVDDALYEPFLERFVSAMAAVEASDPRREDTVLGPLSSQAAAERLQRQVDTAIAQGATLRLGGIREGTFFAPTVLTDVTAEMDVYRQELFGPAAVVYRVHGEAEAVRVANDTPFGLGSYVFTVDPEQADRVADALQAGMVYVNVVLADSPELPFGGVKHSGTARELGLLAADQFVNDKLVRIGG